MTQTHGLLVAGGVILDRVFQHHGFVWGILATKEQQCMFDIREGPRCVNALFIIYRILLEHL